MFRKLTCSDCHVCCNCWLASHVLYKLILFKLMFYIRMLCKLVVYKEGRFVGGVGEEEGCLWCRRTIV